MGGLVNGKRSEVNDEFNGLNRKGGKEVVSEKDREYSRKFSSTIGKLLNN